MSLIPVRANGALPYTVVVCGDVLPQPRLLRELQSAAADITVIQCSEERGTLSLCQRMGASVLLARQAFLSDLPGSELVQLTDYGRGTHLVAVLDSDGFDAAEKMLRLGCRGILPPRFSTKVLKQTVSSVLDGEICAPPRVVADLLSALLKLSTKKNKEESSLTPQEQRILDLTAQGLKNSAIAEALFISPSTVRWHKRRLYRKIGGKSRKPSEKVSPRSPESAAG
jgi:two-component system nitrate/nitrite response regulator NarL